MGHSVKGMTLRLCVAVLAAATAWLAACGGGGRGVVDEQNRFAGPTTMAVAPNFLDPYGHYLFVANSQGGTISVINAHSYQVLSAHTDDVNDYDVIRVGRAPHRIALTPAGDRLFVTDAWEDTVRIVSGWAGRRPDIFDVKVVFDEVGNKFLRYEIAVTELDTVVRAGEIAMPSFPDSAGSIVPVFVTDPDNDRVVVLDSETGAAIDEIPLPESPTNIAVTPTGNLVFVTGDEGRLYIIDGDDFTLLVDLTLDLGGTLGRIVTSDDGDELYVLNNDPPRLQVIGLNPVRLITDDVRLQASTNGIARSGRGDWIYIAGDDGYVYVFDPTTRRICNSWGGRVFLDDEWPTSNTRLERIDVKDCRVLTEQWEVVFQQFEGDWTVRGSRSGLQIGRAQSNQYYVTDDGALGFFIRDDDQRASDEDTFYFETNVGIEPIRVGLVPDDIIATPYFLDPEFDVVYVSNAGTDNLSIFFNEENQRLGAVN
ncbi:MAG: YncE family protein [Deltaproteobacteria bacterium]|nr:YncE family protein [Deltaproteobacteria bacterium]